MDSMDWDRRHSQAARIASLVATGCPQLTEVEYQSIGSDRLLPDFTACAFVKTALAMLSPSTVSNASCRFSSVH